MNPPNLSKLPPLSDVDVIHRLYRNSAENGADFCPDRENPLWPLPVLAAYSHLVTKRLSRGKAGKSLGAGDSKTKSVWASNPGPNAPLGFDRQWVAVEAFFVPPRAWPSLPQHDTLHAMADTVLEWLIEQFPNAKKETLKRMVIEGRVRLNRGFARHVNQPLGLDDRLEVLDRPPRTLVDIHPLKIIFEDADILVIHKPAGLLTSTTPNERRPTALAIVQAYVADREPRSRVGLIHRLDAPASGLLVFSKNPTSYESLKRQLFKHEIRRTYATVVNGVPNPRSGVIESQLTEFPDGHVESSGAGRRGARAVTRYDVIRDNRLFSLLRVNLETGRKHQIRVHLKERGWPILGDEQYGGDMSKGDQLLLCAIELEFIHPRTGNRAAFEIAIPPIMTNLVM